MNRRELLAWAGAIGIGLALRTKPSRAAIPHRQVKTTRLFKAPALYPNGLAISPEGLWIAQQKISAAQGALWHDFQFQVTGGKALVRPVNRALRRKDSHRSSAV